MIAKLPPGMVMVNAARGTLVITALIGALRRGHVAAAGLTSTMANLARPGYLP
jgi:phosphoglycerate dehydrogenase-like enzyme